jgi:hypothetical protein
VVDTNVPCTLLFQAYDLTGQIIVGSMLIWYLAYLTILKRKGGAGLTIAAYPSQTQILSNNVRTNRTTDHGDGTYSFEIEFTQVRVMWENKLT